MLAPLRYYINVVLTYFKFQGFCTQGVEFYKIVYRVTIKSMGFVSHLAFTHSSFMRVWSSAYDLLEVKLMLMLMLSESCLHLKHRLSKLIINHCLNLVLNKANGFVNGKLDEIALLTKGVGVRECAISMLVIFANLQNCPILWVTIKVSLQVSDWKFIGLYAVVHLSRELLA